MPGAGLSCFACCPPIRPAGYEHLAHRSSWRRLLAENRADFLRHGPPRRAITGLWCPGLGFLDARGRRAGCLLHPAANQGRDLRGPTGFRDKCARESCPESRAFAALAAPARELLVGLCAGLDAFEFSSRRANPVRRLLALGPEAAAAAVGLEPESLGELEAWGWLAGILPERGWLLARLAAAQGPGVLRSPGLAARLEALGGRLARRLGPAPPHEEGRPLRELCGEWEARLWRGLSGRGRLRPDTLARWRREAEELAARA
jgi:hypothetical protein